MENILKQLDFDEQALTFLQKIEAVDTSQNLATCRRTFNNDKDLLLDSILNLDEVRKVEGENTIILMKKVKRHRKVA